MSLCSMIYLSSKKRANVFTLVHLWNKNLTENKRPRDNLQQKQPCIHTNIYTYPMKYDVRKNMI